jgi:hypothetical protein
MDRAELEAAGTVAAMMEPAVLRIPFATLKMII